MTDNPRRHRTLRWAPALLALALLAAACGGDGQATTTTTGSGDGSTTTAAGATTTTAGDAVGGSFVVGLTSDPTGLTANTTAAVTDSTVSRLTYEPLVRLDTDGLPVPLLAESWDVSEDGRTYTFTLVEANFSDGEPMTSEDVAFSLLEVSAEYSPHFGRMKGQIESIETPDDRTVVVTLIEPYAPFLGLLAVGGQILPKHVYEGTDPLTNPATTESPVGTGPFVLAEWVRGSHLRYEKNPDYWQDGKPYLDEVIFQVIPTPSQRVVGLRSGQLHWIDQSALPQSDYATVESTPGLVLVDTSYPPLDEMLHFNVRSGPTADPAVRKALAKAIDREFIVQSAFFGYGAPGVNAIDSRVVWAHDPSIDYRELFPYDPEQAAADLDAAGYPVGADGSRFTLRLLVQADIAADHDTGAAIAQMWEAVGVDVNFETLDRATVTERTYTNPDFDARVGSYSAQSDPAIGIARSYVTGSIGTAFGNASGYSNPEVDQRFADATTVLDVAERKRLYTEAAAIIAEDLPVLLLVEKITYDGYSDRVLNAEVYLTPDFAEIQVRQP